VLNCPEGVIKHFVRYLPKGVSRLRRYWHFVRYWVRCTLLNSYLWLLVVYYWALRYYLCKSVTSVDKEVKSHKNS